MARIGQSRPSYGCGFQVEDLTTFSVVPSSFGSGTKCVDRREGTAAGDVECIEHNYSLVVATNTTVKARVWPLRVPLFRQTDFNALKLFRTSSSSVLVSSLELSDAQSI